jgi:hypothetical protein
LPLLGAQRIDAGSDGEPRQPVLERNAVARLVTIEAGKHLLEDLLGEVFLGDGLRSIGSHEPHDQRMVALDQFPRGLLVAARHSGEARHEVPGPLGHAVSLPTLPYPQ